MSEVEQCSSRNIPLPIQREVRQRCGFGCVICGLPLYEYEHMEEWAVVKRHVANEITLLCDQHHKEKTNGFLPKEVVAHANNNPFNLRTGISKPYDLHFYGQTMAIKIGTNTFKRSVLPDESFCFMSAVVVDGIPLISFIIQDNHVLLNVYLFDKYNNLLLSITNNQLVYNVLNWDIQLISTRLIIREGAGNILLEINFQPPNAISITRGRLLCNGLVMKIQGESVILNDGTNVQGNSVTGCDIGIAIGERSRNIGVTGIALDVDRSNQSSLPV